MLLGTSRPDQDLYRFLQAEHYEAIALGSSGVELSSLPSENVARAETVGFVLFSFSATISFGHFLLQDLKSA